MADKSTPVTEKHFDYIAEHTTKEDEFLISLKEAASKEGIPSIWISPEQASFMQILLKLYHVRTVIEVGTLAGYSAIWMARALSKDSRLYTIEINPKFSGFAKEWISKSDVSDCIEVICDSGENAIKKFKNESADAIFLDADKPNYPKYLKEGMRILRKGGLIMADNAFAFGELFEENPEDKEVEAMRNFNEIIAKEKRLHSIIVPLGDGLWIGVKLF